MYVPSIIGYFIYGFFHLMNVFFPSLIESAFNFFLFALVRLIDVIMHRLGAASCKTQQEKKTQQENTFLGIKCVFLLSYFFLLVLFFLVDFYMKWPYVHILGVHF